MTIELGKKYEARDGSVWRVVCVDNVGVQPVVAVDTIAGGATEFHVGGEYYYDKSEGPYDLIREHVPAPELVAHYQAILNGGSSYSPAGLFATVEDARYIYGSGYVLRLATEYPAIMLPRKEPR